ncbi:MAG: precorrin-6A/cobalt-precorrin-6A reductase, partial [Paracoccaceae bacterium]
MLLLLAGTAEARELATAMGAENIPVIASLSGATRDPAALQIPCRTGGFGGAEAFRSYLTDAGITAIL